MVLLRERTRPGLGIIAPCLPSPAKAPPSGPGWIHEIKHDGFRIMARRDGAGARLFTRHGHDFTARFPLAAAALAALPGCSMGDRRKSSPSSSIRSKAQSTAAPPLRARRINSNTARPLSLVTIASPSSRNEEDWGR
jgi:hypothetical protein